MKNLVICLIAAGTIVIATSSLAKEHERRQPPQEAIEACVDMAEDSQVSFVTPRGDSLDSVCKMINNTLVAVPLNPPKKPKGQQSTQD